MLALLSKSRVGQKNSHLGFVVWAAEVPRGGRPRGPGVPREAPRDLKYQQDFENDHTEGRGKREEGRREEGKKGKKGKKPGI